MASDNVDQAKIIQMIDDFIIQANTGTLEFKKYSVLYRGFKVKASFGQGIPANTPWISFYSNGNKSSQGIYVCFLYYKNLHKLVLSLGISEQSISSVSWPISFTQEYPLVKDVISKTERYGDSFVFHTFDVTPSFQFSGTDGIVFLNKALDIYGEVVSNKKVNFYKITPPDLGIHGDVKHWMEKGIISLPVDTNIGDLYIYTDKEEFLLQTGLSKDDHNARKYWNFKTAKKGDIVFISTEFMSCLGIGIIDGDYLYDKDEPSIYKHKKSVKWITDKVYKYIPFAIPGYPEMFHRWIFGTTKIGKEIIQEYLKIYPELKDIFDENGLNYPLSTFSPVIMSNGYTNLNTILYGVPGTGKTHHSINYALSIIEGVSLEQLMTENREDLNFRFQKYAKDGNIVFTTFHQSFSYEEFIEGMRASTENGAISYEIEDGIFKTLCKKAKHNFELSNKDEVEIKNEISINHKIEKFILENIENETVFKKKKGEFSITNISNGKIYIRSKEAIAKNEQVSIKIDELKTLLLSGQKISNSSDIRKFLQNTYVRQTDSYLRVLLDELMNPSLNLDIDEVKIDSRLKKYVIIIDEINRGNISKIFGELITLIEPSKRIGETEGIELRLSYSKDVFGVPKNLYIIGTMNTSDRSISLMDIALRRRFVFKEMLPESSLLQDIHVDTIHIRELFTTINKRIEYLYDRDHILGHAIFLPLKYESTIEKLNEIFFNSVIPLLQEYFYDDWEKIQIILGDHDKQKYKSYGDKIIVSQNLDQKEVLGFNHGDISDEKISYFINQNPTLDSYIGIYKSVL